MTEALGAKGEGRGARGQLADYLSLAKPRTLGLVVVTALAALALAGQEPRPGLVAVTLLGGGLAAAGANALNCYLDRDIDALMPRTRGRPLPARRLPPRAALLFGAALSLAGPLVLGLWANWLAAALALAANGYYLVVYTAWLKRATPWSIVVGGAAGAAAPLIGWAASGREFTFLPFCLAALVLCWTPAHFWSLALLVAEEYRAAGVPMWPVAFGERATKRWILGYAALSLLVSLLPAAVGLLGIFYLAAAVVLGAGLVAAAWMQNREAGLRWSRLTFRYSVLYLGLICLAMVVDSSAAISAAT